MKLFTLGPVEFFPDTRGILRKKIPYFRTDEFSEIETDCAERLKRIADAPRESRALLLTSSGTGAMEAAVAGLFSAKDRLLVVNGGGFGQRFCELCALHGIPYEAVSVPFGAALTREMLEAALPAAGSRKPAFTGLLVNMHETSTGQLYDMDMIAGFCRDYNLYHVVDAIGSFLADPLSVKRHGIDALILSSHKGLALPPGLAPLVLSERLFRKATCEDIPPFSAYFDLRDAEQNARRGQTPFTPAILTICALRERLRAIEAEGGADAQTARTAELARDFRRKAFILPAELPAHPLSSACTPLIFPHHNAQEIWRKLYERYEYYVNPTGGEWEGKLLRVGHLGNLTIDDNTRLIWKLQTVLNNL
ncbi:MAG: aminotransferase class V-fold PLP-dependent enzyme [Clostridiales bacterium]|nr:aminotransferase class V-fold PLP-dependent enzyme [Clostridiales bacterium]